MITLPNKELLRPDLFKEAKELGRIARREAAKQLVSARLQFRKIKKACKDAADELAQSKAGCPSNTVSLLLHEYPSVPEPKLEADPFGTGMPSASGVYFFWDDSAVVYVGQSVKLVNRVRLGSHHVLREHHHISYVLIPVDELNWAEAFYIGVLRPRLNFGVGYKELCKSKRNKYRDSLRTAREK